ncbi:hypothetical protein SUDANB120_05677 [Streptomyces sp. enrichment culture]|uniref:alpha/beta hydrolase family protein n=1 Tax=Streptomyces sp. enrichment culture TaxID=1795815 RepID=UPI003F57D2EB
MITLPRAAAAAVLACTLALPATAAAAAAPDTSAARPAASDAASAGRMRLPAPTGAHGVGSTVLHLVDRSRKDPWEPAADGRELMVTLHYPAARRAHGRPAPYATEPEARELLKAAGAPDSPSSAGELARLRTHGAVDARPAPGRHPLVVLSPGFGAPRFTLTNLAEELASRGYVVASVDHAYESSGTSLPDGRLLTCTACTVLDGGGVPGSTVTAARAADTRFLLDRLTGPAPAWRHAASIDASRIGMAGHSIGGASAATAMLADPRIDAGVNMDGSFWDVLPAGGLQGRPFMLLGTDDDMHRPGGADTTWDTTWQALGGWKRWLTVAGTDHYSFSDAPVIQRHFGLPAGDIPAERALAVTRAYTAAFFDQHLRGQPRQLLDGPAASHPEVRFHQP